MEYDYSKFEETAADDNILARISATADALVAKEREIEQAEAKVKQLKEEYRIIQEVTLPKLMEEGHTISHTTSNGNVIELREDVRCSLAKERVIDGLDWLRKHKHDSIIKTQVVAEFDRGNDASALDYYNKIRRELNNAETKLTSGVHPQTLLAFIKERLNAGDPEIMSKEATDLFKISTPKVAKVKSSKRGK